MLPHGAWVLHAHEPACVRIASPHLGEEAEVVPILLGELDQGCLQRLRRLLDKLFEIDDLCQHVRDRTWGLRGSGRRWVGGRSFRTTPLMGTQHGLSLRSRARSEDHTVFVNVRALEDRVDLLVLDEGEPQRVQGRLDFLLVERAIAVIVPAREK